MYTGTTLSAPHPQDGAHLDGHACSTHCRTLIAVPMPAGPRQTACQDGAQTSKAPAAPVPALNAFAASAGLKPRPRMPAYRGGLMNPATTSDTAARARPQLDRIPTPERLRPLLEES